MVMLLVMQALDNAIALRARKRWFGRGYRLSTEQDRDKPNPFSDHQLFCEKAIDALEDSIDCFWENPLAFALCVHHRHIDDMTDVFAGRIYPNERQPSPPINDFRKLLKRQDEREASYGKQGADYSVPIGSRYHPERAAIWQANSLVETTEAWLGPR